MAYLTDGASIDWRAQKDRYDNDVSLIKWGCGWSFRMVHHTPMERARQRATIYAKDKKFVRVEMFAPNDDCMSTFITIAGYRMEWGDGDPGTAENNPLGRDLKSALEQICEDDFDLVILTVLGNIKCHDALWETKAPTAQAADAA